MHTKYAKSLIFALAVFSLNSAKAEISWSVGPDLPNPYNEPAPFTRYHGMAYCNGYVYVIGGNIAGGEHVPENNWPLGDNPHIYYAKVESPGVLGEWSVASANLPGYPGSDLGGTSPLKPHYVYIGRRTFSYNGKIYVVGGYGSYPTGSAYPERAQTLIITPEANGDIIESSMVIQDWDTAPARWESSVTVNPETGAVYMVSGFNTPGTVGASSQSSDIYCAQIQPDGFLSPWNFFGNLSITHDASSQNQSNICWMPAVVMNNKLYTISGRIAAGTIRSIQYCDLNTVTTGSVEMIDAGEIGYLPDARIDHGATVMNGKIYVYGGSLTNSNANSSSRTYVAEADPETGAITSVVNINQDIPAVTVAGGSAIQGLRRIPNGVTDGQAIYLAGGVGVDPANTASLMRSNATYIAKDNANVENFFLY